jgi:hypothetical protein
MKGERMVKRKETGEKVSEKAKDFFIQGFN